MDQDVNFGIQDNTIQDILKMTYFMAMEISYMQIELYILVNGKKENKMVKAF